MKFSQRVPRSEIHLYFQKLYAKGYKKTDISYHKGGHVVTFVKDAEPKEVLRVKFSNNGWCSFLG